MTGPLWVVCIVGAALLWLSTYWRAGATYKARWWAGSEWNEHIVLMVLPGGGVFLVVGSLTPLALDGGLLVLPMSLLLIGALVLLLWGAFSLPVPEWFKPTWLRETRR